jgi:hypothetical protein
LRCILAVDSPLRVRRPLDNEPENAGQSRRAGPSSQLRLAYRSNWHGPLPHGAWFQEPKCGGPPRSTAASPVLRIGLPPRYLLQHMANKQRVIDQVAVSEPSRLRHQAE